MISSSSQVSSIRSHQYHHRPQRKSPSGVSFAAGSHHHHHHHGQHQRALSKSSIAAAAVRSQSEGHIIGAATGGDNDQPDEAGVVHARSDSEGARTGSFFNFLRPRNLRKSISRAVRNFKSDQGQYNIFTFFCLFVFIFLKFLF